MDSYLYAVDVSRGECGVGATITVGHVTGPRIAEFCASGRYGILHVPASATVLGRRNEQLLELARL